MGPVNIYQMISNDKWQQQLQETLPTLVFELPEDLREAFFKCLFSMHFSHIFKTECSPLVSRDFSTLSVGGDTGPTLPRHVLWPSV